MYLEALNEDDEIPFQFNDEPRSDDQTGDTGPTVRKDVDTGADVLDINVMRAELEEARRTRRGGQG